MTEPTDGKTAPKGDRIAKLLARAGVASRREIERMIAEGRVALDGVVLDTPATILSSLRGVTVDGQPVAAPEAARLYLYHKPTGLLVTERDPAGRPTIYDRLPADLPRTVPVGRLDLNTEGLLLLTTDGGLKRQLELPATGVERTYRARAYGNVTQAMLEELIEGIEIDGVRYGPIDANLERRTGANVWIEMTLTEGKNREVRRVLEHLGLQVGRLIRTRYGPFILADLPPGEVGEVKQHDLVAFVKTLGSTRRAKGADLQSLVTVEPRAKPARAAAPEPAARPAREPDRPLRRVAEAPRPVAPASGGWGSRTRPSRPAAPTDAAPARGSFRLSDDRTARPARASDRPVRDGADLHSGGRSGRPPRAMEERPRFGSGAARPSRPSGNPRTVADRAGYQADTRSTPARSGTSRATDDHARSATDAGRNARPASNPRGAFSDRARPAADARAGNPRGGPPRPSDERARPTAGARTARTAGDPRASYTDRADRPTGPHPARPGTLSPSGKGPSGGRGHPPRAPKGGAKPPRGGGKR